MTLKEVPKQNTVTFSEESVMTDKIDNLTSLIGKLATQNRQSRPFKSRVGADPENFSGKTRCLEMKTSYAWNDKKFRGCNTFRDNRN